MLRAAMVALLLISGCAPRGRAAGASLELPRNAADHARRFQLPRTPTGDVDRDGVLDRDDACPRELEFYDGKADLDGCPDNGRGVVQIDEDNGKIELAFGHELEFYDDDDGFIPWRHEETLEQVAWFLRAHPRFATIEIEQIGDASSECEGFDCDRHADSIRMFLVSRGLSPERVQVGLGSSGFGLDRDPAFPHRPIARVELAVR
jgi:hypothetical protein